MAKFIINDKVYDTHKMTRIGTVAKWYKFTGIVMRGIWGNNSGRKFDCEIYKSDKGNFLLVRENDCAQICGEAIEEDEAKALLKSYDYDAYARLYGELEEA